MELFIILMLILLNGVFSMSEIALVSSRKTRLESAVRAGKKGAGTALKLASSPNQFLSTVQIGITLIGLLTGIYSGENITNDLERWLMQYETVEPVADGLAVTIVLIITTFFTLILGELVPKRLGLANPEGISRMVAPFMKFLSRIAYPFVWILSHISDQVFKIFNIKPSKTNITEEEIKAIIREGTMGGEIQKIEQNIVERVFVLGDRKISSLMTPRSDLAFMNVEDDFPAIRGVVNKDLHRIYPVFKKDKDNIVGVIDLKDLFVAFQSANFNLKNYVKPAHFLPEATSAYNALEKFKASNVHYALVIDEFGLLLGMVTMDDILQALVGDPVEFNKEDYQILQLQDGTWLVDGQYPLIDFLMYFELGQTERTNHIITVAGLILEKLKHIPTVGEKVHWNGLILEVVDLDNIKIDKILVKRQSGVKDSR